MTSRWEDVEYTSEAVADVRAQALVTTLERSFANGRVLLARLVPTDPAAFSAAARNDLRGHDHLLGAFLASASVQHALHDLAIQTCRQIPPAFRSIGAFEFEGALTHTLVAGGAYGGEVPEEAARQLSRDFVDACFDGHRLAVNVFRIDGAWTDWFYDVAWDGSYCCLDPIAGCWTALFFTDTD